MSTHEETIKIDVPDTHKATGEYRDRMLGDDAVLGRGGEAIPIDENPLDSGPWIILRKLPTRLERLQQAEKLLTKGCGWASIPNENWELLSQGLDLLREAIAEQEKNDETH